MEQQFSLSWNNFHGNLSKGFTGLLGKGEFVDVTIAVEGHLLQAHKVILSICSPYFKKMFQMNPCQHPIVVLRDVTHKAMRDLLQFMYHGEVSVKREDLTSFIGTAEVLQIKGLTNKETDEEDYEKEKELPIQNIEVQNNTLDRESNASDTFDTPANDSINENNDVDILKQRHFIEKLQKFSNMKRKSEEFLQKNYYQDLLSTEKRAKLKDKIVYYGKNSQNNFDCTKGVDENLTEASHELEDQNVRQTSHANDKCNEQSFSEGMELKTECDESDIIVTDPAVCTSPKNYDSSTKDAQKDMPLPLDYQSPQDNCTSLNSLFIDLKNLVNGKICNSLLRENSNEEFSRHVTELSDHRLVTIPQKEDGKKKYPQRSCRLCWKIGKRRDTRFMCSACEMPFCKSPCFEIHFNDVIKSAQVQGDFYGKIKHAI